MNKTKMLILMIPLLLFSSCGGNIPEELKDTDFDGLYDSVDPDINNPTYSFHVNGYTNSKEITIDYRKIVNALPGKYDAQTALLASLLVNESYNYYLTIENNKVSGDGSNISNLLYQIGCQDLRLMKMEPNSFNEDKYDACNLKIGHHLFQNINGKKMNVFFCELQGYVDSTGWISNFDIGADGDNYLDFNSGPHTNWSDKKYHKGFQVTANRLYSMMDSYIQEFSLPDYENFVFATGQSRSGAIISIVGKMLQDNNIKNLIYAFNSPTQISDTNLEDIRKYTNVISIINDDDFVHLVPLNCWDNFEHIGTMYHYKVSDHVDAYDSLFIDQTYPNINADLKNELLDIVGGFAIDRNGIYDFRPEDPNFEEVIYKNNYSEEPFETKVAAEIKMEKLWNAFGDNKELAEKVIDMEVTEADSNKWKISYKTKPAIILAVLNTLMTDTSSTVNEIITPYLPFFKRYINELSPLLIPFIEELPDTALQIPRAHEPLQTLVGVDYVTPLDD